MKTDELIAMLAGGTVAVEAGASRRRYATAMGWGAFGAALLMAIVLGVREDLYAAALQPMFWVKLAYPAAILAGALLAAERLSRPGARLGRALPAIAAPVIAMWLLAAWSLGVAQPAVREALLFGESWDVCPFYVALLSVPAFAALMWAVRGLAPTRLVLAGAAVGLVSGATAALVYSLHCPEMAAPFIGTWYLLGMLIPTAAGAALGPFLLRW